MTIVVDFQALGGGVSVVCAPGPVTSGLDALDRAGVSWEGTKRFPSFVCRIAGRPEPAAEPCANTPPATAYWSYWLAPHGGPWCYSNFGAGNRRPPPGSVEGWSFSLHHTSGDIPKPRYAPPAPIGRTTPNQLRGGDCTVPASSKPPTTNPTPVRAAGGSGVSGGGSTASRVDATPPAPESAANGSGTRPGARGAGKARTTTTRPAAATSPTVAPGGITTTSPATHDERDGEVAVNAVDLGKDGRGGSGSPIALLVAIAVIAGLAATATLMTRRRRRRAKRAPPESVDG